MKDNNLIQPLGFRGKKLFEKNIKEKNVLAKLKGTHGESVVLTDQRIYILKWGFMAGHLIEG
ncbi:MAG: hypothetical protein WC220_13485, partial [Pedobacter sp.]